MAENICSRCGCLIAEDEIVTHLPDHQQEHLALHCCIRALKALVAELSRKAVHGPIRALNHEERARWGECPVCRAEHGVACDYRVDIPLDGSWEEAGGAHLARLEAAPFQVREEIHG